MSRIKWQPVIDDAARIVAGYDTPVTLRQLYYQLVARQSIENRDSAYKRLSELTAQGRRDGTFPDLTDETRGIVQPYADVSVSNALQTTAGIYRLDRTLGQDVSIYLGVEKRGIVQQLRQWFGDDLGLPILPLGGYCSQSFVDEIRAHVQRQGRPAVLLYAGDHDPSGWDIPRDFVERTDCWKEVRRIALTPEQVEHYGLPEAPGKPEDPRGTGFVARFGRLVQVEVDALPPETLRGLYADAIADFWDTSRYNAVCAVEARDRARLQQIADELGGDDE